MRSSICSVIAAVFVVAAPALAFELDHRAVNSTIAAFKRKQPGSKRLFA